MSWLVQMWIGKDAFALGRAVNASIHSMCVTTSSRAGAFLKTDQPYRIAVRTGAGMLACTGEMRSVGDHGLGFEILETLPLGPDGAGTHEETVRSAAGPDPQPSPGTGLRRRILVVDDQPEVRALLTEHLEAHWYTVIEAGNAEEALQRVRHDRPDLILLDVGLPGMNGLEVLRRVRRDDPMIGIIMVAGLDDEALARSTVQLGALEYVRKPFDLEHLRRVVQAGLAAR